MFQNRRVRALINFLVGAVIVGGLIIFWEPLGQYTLTFLNVKLIGMRLVVGLIAVGIFLEGLNFLGIIHWFDD